jgi:hypothetical protein
MQRLIQKVIPLSVPVHGYKMFQRKSENSTQYICAIKTHLYYLQLLLLSVISDTKCSHCNLFYFPLSIRKYKLMTVGYVNFSSIPIYHIFSVMPPSMGTKERGIFCPQRSRIDHKINLAMLVVTLTTDAVSLMQSFTGCHKVIWSSQTFSVKKVPITFTYTA